MCPETGAFARKSVLGSESVKFVHLLTSFSMLKTSKSWERVLLLASFDGWFLKVGLQGVRE